jgi:hypothetical protein
LPANIHDVNPHCLARLAIASVKPCLLNGSPDKNGIRYLAECIALGIRTSLTDAFREEVLRISKSKSLNEAEQWAAQ